MSFPAPLAVIVGATHVSIAQTQSGKWVVMSWDRAEGPRLVCEPCAYQEATERARGYAFAMPGAILDLPTDFGLIHVSRRDYGFEVIHESSSGESFASLGNFGPDDRDAAIMYAASQLGIYAPCKLGEIAQ